MGRLQHHAGYHSIQHDSDPPQRSADGVRRRYRQRTQLEKPRHAARARLPQHNAMGDLGTVRIDHQHPETVFAQFTGCQSCTANVLQRSLDGGRNFTEVHTGIAEVGGTPPFAIDPANTAHPLLATSPPCESMDSASTWRPIFTFDGSARNRVATLAMGPGGAVIYAWTNNQLLASHDHR